MESLVVYTCTHEHLQQYSKKAKVTEQNVNPIALSLPVAYSAHMKIKNVFKN
jgi:hypothetical protein